MDTDSTAAGTDTPDSGPAHRVRRVRRPVNGGWVLMIGAGLLAAVTNYAVLTMDDPVTQVVILSQAAPVGTPVSQLQLSVQRMAIADPHSRGLVVGAQLSTITDMVTAYRLPAGLMLRHSDVHVSTESQLGDMSIPVDAARAAGGRLQAGDQVDVIAELQGTTDYVATGLDIVDVVVPGTGVGQAGGSYAVTVAVDTDQAVALARAMRSGEIDLVRTAQAAGQ